MFGFKFLKRDVQMLGPHLIVAFVQDGDEHIDDDEGENQDVSEEKQRSEHSGEGSNISFVQSTQQFLACL